jgi:hypothetical protein
VLRFEPQYPLQPGVTYEVFLDRSRIPTDMVAGRSLKEAATTARQPITQRFVLPKADAVATTVVERVYPTTNVLPENLLKFYVHFSAPMSRGSRTARWCSRR